MVDAFVSVLLLPFPNADNLYNTICQSFTVFTYSVRKGYFLLHTLFVLLLKVTQCFLKLQNETR